MTERVFQKGFEGNTLTGEVSFVTESVGMSGKALLRRFKDLHSVVGERSIWLERPSGKPLYMDLRNDPTWSIKLKSQTWEKDEVIKQDKVGGLKRLPGLVLVTGPIDFNGGESLDKLKFSLMEVEKGLQKHSSVVMVIEDKGEDVDKEPRLNFLKEMNFVQPNVLKRVGKKRVVWEARKVKKPGTKEVNLVESSKNQESKYLKRIAQRVKEMYLKGGYEVIGWKEIHKRLKASLNVWGDLNRLREGYGVSLRVVECGCTADIDLDGEFTNHHTCGDSACSFPLELPEMQERKQERRYNLIEVTDTGMACMSAGGGCDSNLLEQVTMHTQGTKKSIVLTNTYCPHHGLYDDTEKQVDNSLIDGLS